MWRSTERNHKGKEMININNQTPRTIKTPDGYGELFCADEQSIVVKVQDGDKRFLKIYTHEQCYEIPEKEK